LKTGATAITYNPELDKFLLVKRAETKQAHPEMWEFPGGKIKEDEDPRTGVIRELKEETGFEGQVIRSGEPGAVHYEEGSYMIHPFLVLVESDEVELSEEHMKYRWIELDELEEFDTVSGLEDELRSLDLFDSPLEVVSCVVERDDGKILIMKRVKKIRLFPGKWDFPSGRIEDERPENAAKRELEEETSIKADVEKTGESFELDTDYGAVKVHPFLFEVLNPKVKMNWEHDNFEWIAPEDIENYETVDGLKRDLEALDVV